MQLEAYFKQDMLTRRYHVSVSTLQRAWDGKLMQLTNVKHK